MSNRSENRGSTSALSSKELEVLEAIRGIVYGTVLVVIHNREVVQIETTNKKRFTEEKADRQREPLTSEFNQASVTDRTSGSLRANTRSRT